MASSLKLFLAFPDGVYDYSCSTCDALCCRGHGFAGNLKREMSQLLRIYPALGNAAIGQNGDVVSFANPSGSCHFLEKDNRCRIEKEHGKALKPGVCSLFPFNNFSRVGSTVVISPHFLCPLRYNVPARPGKVAGTHSLIERAARDSGLLDAMGDRSLKDVSNGAALIRRERKFRDACSEALGKLTFREMLWKQSKDSAALKKFVPRAAALLGIPYPASAAPRDSIDDLMLALASPLRIKFILQESEEVLRILALGEIFLRHMSTLSSSPPTLQGASNIIIVAANSLRLLAAGDSAFPLPKQVEGPHLTFKNPEMTIAAFQILQDSRRSSGILGALEKSILPSLSAADRTLLLGQVLGRLEWESKGYQKKLSERAGTELNP